jgi:hypothetical protein
VISFSGDLGVLSQSIETALVVLGVAVPDDDEKVLEGVPNGVIAIGGKLCGVVGRAAAFDNDRLSNWYVSIIGILSRV